MDKQTILSKLPAFNGSYELIHPKQTVGDIISEVLNAHHAFADHYNSIALCFDQDTEKQVCKNLYSFCKANFDYDEQDEDNQQTMSPGAMIHLQKVDCKNYAGFIGGVLDGLNRLTDRKISWAYRFASYDFFDRTPHHVFVVVNPGYDEMWLDPTPGSSNKSPTWEIDKKVKVSKMALHRVSGTNNNNDLPKHRGIVNGQLKAVVNAVDNEPQEVPPDVLAKIQLLYDYGILDQTGNFNYNVLLSYQNTLPIADYAALEKAWNEIVVAATVGSFFGGIWHGIKAVSFLVPRSCYKLVVRLNLFHTATKLKQVISTPEGLQKVLDKWYSVGGSKDGDNLQHAIEEGYKIGKHTVGYAAGGTAALVASAAVIIAAIAPIINSLINKQKQNNQIIYPEAAQGELNPSEGSSPMDFIKNNPIPVAAAAGILMFFLTKEKGKKPDFLAPGITAGAVYFFLSTSQQQDVESKRQYLIAADPSRAATYKAFPWEAVLQAFNNVVASGVFDGKDIDNPATQEDTEH